ncbi:unnamed protein product [Nyctereutes procyonoides]|uniref:(raccoon dog) hypothetical protein n=1 Tax=Nyctereutes procyonoides TaxID=34880 RepID=A0A811YGP8_NYCPR|nr:unnamed protein product [Nyctereutes procyonoides]
MELNTPYLPQRSGRRTKEDHFNSIFLNFIYLFMRDTQREAGTQAEGRRRSRLPAGSPIL